MMYRRRSCETIVTLNQTLRKLWEQHIMWTRSLIISIVDELGDLDAVTERLLRNPSDFAAVLTPYYGQAKVARFETLFKEHLSIAANLVNQAKAGNAEKTNAARQAWYANAAEIATFLSQINPYWNRQAWKQMLEDHLKMTEQEAVTRLQQKYQANVALYEEIEKQALKMADAMTSGILNQFY